MNNIEKVSELYRKTLEEIKILNNRLTRLKEEIKTGSKMLSYHNYTMKQHEAENIEKEIIEKEIYAKAVSDTREILLKNDTKNKKSNYQNDAHLDAIHDAFYDLTGTAPIKEIVTVLYAIMPEDIKLEADRWGWSDTDVNVKVYGFVDDFLKFNKGKINGVTYRGIQD